MSDERIINAFFAEPEPATPTSLAPDLGDLRGRLRARRRGRRLVGTSAFGAMALCMIASAWMWSGSRQSTESVPEQPMIAEVKSKVASNSPLPETTATVRVFAKVHRSIPIFGREGESEYLRHVGWIASEEMVPVDLSQFPAEQKKTIESVLHNDDPTTSINL
jgi:hypothetical protein